jgi:hypothetical protein
MRAHAISSHLHLDGHGSVGISITSHRANLTKVCIAHSRARGIPRGPFPDRSTLGRDIFICDLRAALAKQHLRRRQSVAGTLCKAGTTEMWVLPAKHPCPASRALNCSEQLDTTSRNITLARRLFQRSDSCPAADLCDIGFSNWAAPRSVRRKACAEAGNLSCGICGISQDIRSELLFIAAVPAKLRVEKRNTSERQGKGRRGAAFAVVVI